MGWLEKQGEEISVFKGSVAVRWIGKHGGGICILGFCSGGVARGTGR